MAKRTVFTQLAKEARKLPFKQQIRILYELSHRYGWEFKNTQTYVRWMIDIADEGLNIIYKAKKAPGKPHGDVISQFRPSPEAKTILAKYGKRMADEFGLIERR